MPESSAVLLVNGLTLALALSMLLLTLWRDAGYPGNQIFALFLFSVLIWSSGSLLARATAYVGASRGTVQLGLTLLDIGFMSASISIYVYSAIMLTGGGSAIALRFGLILAYQALLIVTGTPRTFDITPAACCTGWTGPRW